MKRISVIGCAVLMSVLCISGTSAQSDSGPMPEVVSAYYGLDSALPFGANGLCLGANGQDGMPVVLSQVIDPDTLDAEDFSVTTASGVVSTPFCVTLSPAVDAGELRTVLLIGEFGSAESDPPVRVDVVGELRGSTDGANFMGAGVEVTPLAAGPTLIVSESVPAAQWMLDRGSGRQQGDGCPSEGTMQIVRATWAGGVSNAEGDEAGEPERLLYRVALRQHDGSLVEATPFALADLGDGDNNHLLCLNVGGQPESVFFPAGHLYDPNRDTLNPDTTIAIQPDTTLNSQQVRNVRYCEVVPTYRSGVTLRTEIWNTLGLNDCPQTAWDALDAAELETQLGAVNVRLNGPRYWVIDEIAAVGGVTATGEQMTFGTIDMTLRAILETRLRGDLVGDQLYTPNTVQRDTRYVFYAGELMYTLTSPEGDVYAMQSFAQIIDPTLTIDALESLGERLSLPEGWTYQAVRLAQDYFLLSGGETTIIQDDFLNTYQRIRIPLPNAAL